MSGAVLFRADCVSLRSPNSGARTMSWASGMGGTGTRALEREKDPIRGISIPIFVESPISFTNVCG